jgi:uncharacterized protein (DUF1697 family)
MTPYVALLRGINVGGKNLIGMAALKSCLEEHGFRDVATYIQSGNVVFRAGGSERAKLAPRIEAALAATFGGRLAVVVRSRVELKAIVESAPEGFGGQPSKYRYDVVFLKEPLTARAALSGVPLKEGVDEARAGPGVLYLSKRIAKASQSRLSRVSGLPIYQSMTIRNWNTTTKLLAMLEAVRRGSG